ncbi:hypothetical protein FQN54_001561 [Arachnomyces sp. PD_36]|nr:hypothetical protein FQN54_001561 [Arachnomyces sp. PD_36]
MQLSTIFLTVMPLLFTGITTALPALAAEGCFIICADGEPFCSGDFTPGPRKDACWEFVKDPSPPPAILSQETLSTSSSSAPDFELSLCSVCPIDPKTGISVRVITPALKPLDSHLGLPDIFHTSTTPSEASSGYTGRRGHAPHLSISDDNHHVTEAIGYMYDDDYDRRDSRRLSYMSSPLSETITTPSNMSALDSTRSSGSAQEQLSRAPTNEKDFTRPNGQNRRSAIISGSFDRENGPPSPTLNRSQSDTATMSFPLNDIDYESDPAAVAQEFSNLAAIRRMSMDVNSTGDPDLPALNSSMMPSIAPSASADENDTSRLFWVPARIHPELAPKEFKSFLESKTDQIQRKAGEQGSSGSLSPERQDSGSSLRRKKSMLSRQIDNSDNDGGEGYTDGAERLEHKRSYSQRARQGRMSPNLHDLEALVEDKPSEHTRSSSLSESNDPDEDRPILPPAPPGHSLRRSTRTTYRKSSLKKGERVPYPRRVARTAAGTSIEEPISTSRSSASPPPEEPPIRPLARVFTDPTDNASPNYSRSAGTSDQAPDSGAEQQENANRSSAPPHSRQWHSRLSSNGRSSLNIPESSQQVPQILESPPQDDAQTAPSTATPRQKLPERISSHDPPPSQPPQMPLPPEPTGSRTKKPGLGKSSKESNQSQSINDMASHPSPLPGNSTRTDSLSFIPTLTEDKKSDGKKGKDKKDSEGGRKSSWHWLLGNEEKDKDKKRDEDGKKSKSKASKATDKSHDNTRLDVLQTSIDGGQRGRESLVLERDPKLEEERKKESARRTSGEPKKEKESGLFSSIFGGSRKKSGDGHKKSSSRNLSPEPPPRELKPDIDYNWTRFSILEERAIYRMAHIKLANPRRPLHSQVLLSNFMYSYLAKVQQMQPQQMSLPASNAPKQQPQQSSNDQPEEYTQYQRYQNTQDQQYADGSAYGGDSQLYDYDDNNDDRDDLYRTQSRDNKQTHENGNMYGQGRHQQYGASHSSYGDSRQDDDESGW